MVAELELAGSIFPFTVAAGIGAAAGRNLRDAY